MITSCKFWWISYDIKPCSDQSRVNQQPSTKRLKLDHSVKAKHTRMPWSGLSNNKLLLQLVAKKNKRINSYTSTTHYSYEFTRFETLNMCLITSFGVNCPACDEYEDKKQTIEECQLLKDNKQCKDKIYETKYKPQICGECQEIWDHVLRMGNNGREGFLHWTFSTIKDMEV